MIVSNSNGVNFNITSFTIIIQNLSFKLQRSKF